MSERTQAAAGAGHWQAFRACLLDFVGDPAESATAHRHFDDGLLVLRDGLVIEVGPARELLPRLPAGVEVVDYSGRLLMPGFVDTHVHYAQTDMIASYGEQLLEWLERYAFPAERKFADRGHAREAADFFLTELLRNGTTTAMVFGTVHSASVDGFFEAAQERSVRMIAGRVMMDRNAPAFLTDDADASYEQSLALIDRWHGRGRLSYAVTPRFAPTSSERQLELAGKLLEARPGVYLQSHVAENRNEVAWVAQLFPWSRSYLDVYDRFGLIRPRAVYAHCLHLDAADRQRMGATGAAMSFCPTSNLFLGSGLFDHAAARAHGVRVGLGTDVGGGTSLSMLRTLNEAYKVAQLAGQRLTPLGAFYLATLGSARALYLDDRIGSFAVGNEADFIVLDLEATPLLARRMQSTATLAERLFVLMMLGDDRAILAAYLMGKLAYARPG